MTELVKFQTIHLEAFFHQPKNSYLRDWVRDGHGKYLESLSTSWTLLKNGAPLMCGGYLEIWPGRAQAWTVFDTTCVQNFTTCFRTMMRILNNCTVRRIEIAIDCGDNNFGRRARMLGFKEEAPRMEAYLSNGLDCALYARVRN